HLPDAVALAGEVEAEIGFAALLPQQRREFAALTLVDHPERLEARPGSPIERKPVLLGPAVRPLVGQHLARLVRDDPDGRQDSAAAAALALVLVDIHGWLGVLAQHAFGQPGPLQLSSALGVVAL